LLVAVIANVAANYIYDWLRPKMFGRWPTVFRFIYPVFVLGTLITCSLIIPMKPRARFIVIGSCALAFGTVLLDVIGITKPIASGKFLFAQMLTTVSLCSLMFLESGFSTAWESKDVTWFAGQIFAAIMASIAIGAIINFIAIRRHVRQRQGLR
jgi:uncharacterized membrane protein (DUF441 family)